jgi:phosphoserine phosphatase RsbU/P
LAVGTLRGVHQTGREPNRVLSVLNERLLLRGIPERHTAIQYALFDPERAEMNIVSRGMPGPIILRGHECRALQLAGMPPGPFPDTEYEEHVLRLEPGDTVLFCANRLTDARNMHQKEFELPGVREVCERHRRAHAVE